MSRVPLACNNANNQLIVGLDPPLQAYFYQLYGPARTVVEDDGEEWEDDSPIEWVVTAPRHEVLEMIEKHCDMNDSWTREVYNLIVLDLDPGEARKKDQKNVSDFKDLMP